MYYFILRQYAMISQGGWPFFWRVTGRALQFLLGLLPALLFLVVMRLLRPWFLIRILQLVSPRIGHFAANTELYLCERDAGINVPKGRFVDLSYHGGVLISNQQLATMWARHLRIWPKWLMEPLYLLNSLVPGGSVHDVGTNTNWDRDVHNLMESFPAHLRFTAEEHARGLAGLKAMNIPPDAEFICLVARDNAYLNTVLPVPSRWVYHNYRDSNIQNYVPAAEALADLGYYVIRMGAVVKEPMKSTHPRVIDYATNGMRSDFMDVYLGAHCLFCLSACAGFDQIPLIFRKPMAFVNVVPAGYLPIGYQKGAICICKRHRLAGQMGSMSLREIFRRGVGFCVSSTCYEAQGIELVENTPEEITAVALEMLDRIKGTWQPAPEDDALQQRFWDIFPTNATDIDGKPLNGSLRGRYGSHYLRENPEWLA